MTLMVKERKDIRPLLVKFGMALALSFAGFLYSRIRTKHIKPSDSPRSPLSSPPVSDSDRKVNYGGGFRIKDDPQPELDCEPSDTYDKTCIRDRIDSSSKNTSPTGRYSGDKDSLLLPEFDQLVKEFDVTMENPMVTSPKTNIATYKIKEPVNMNRSKQSDEYEQEVENLKKMIRALRERERNLEVQLLEYYGLKEQETAMMELQNRLKINNMEAKLFSMKIESLQAYNKRLEAQVADYSKVVTELEAAKAKIKLLKRKIRYEAEQNKEQILQLTQRVAKLRDQEHEAGTSGSDVLLELQRLQLLEAEADELRKSNENLQQENTELARRLDKTQILAHSVLEDPEKEELSNIMLHLREENGNLAMEVERLKADRYADAEELVYLRWINACLRYELRNYQPPPGKTVARDLSKSLSPTSEQKAKQLILEYAHNEGDKGHGIVDFDFDQWPSSHTSYLTDTGDHDDSSGGSSSTDKPHSKKIKFFTMLRRIISGKHVHHHPSKQLSPLLRSQSVDDIVRRYSFESPQRNSCGEAGGDDQRSGSRSPRLTSSSQNSNNSSSGYQPLSSLAEEVAKDMEDGHRVSEVGSTSHGCVRFVLGKESTSSCRFHCRHEQGAEEYGQKSELAKYAEVLRNSRRGLHKKSASFCTG